MKTTRADAGAWVPIPGFRGLEANRLGKLRIAGIGRELEPKVAPWTGGLYEGLRDDEGRDRTLTVALVATLAKRVRRAAEVLDRAKRPGAGA